MSPCRVNHQPVLTSAVIERMKGNATRDDEPWQLDKASFVILCDMALVEAHRLEREWIEREARQERGLA